MTSIAENQVNALEQQVSQVLVDIGECVALLTEPEALPHFVIAERLVPLGSVIIPHLLTILRNPEAGDELLGTAAYLGFTVGDRGECAAALFGQLETDGPWAGDAAHKLAEIGYPGVVPAIESALRRTDAQSFDTIAAYLSSLRSATSVLSDDLRVLLSANAHWQVTTVVADLFPASEDEQTLRK